MGNKYEPKVRADLEDLKPYKVEEKRFSVELDSNESPWNLPDDIIEDIRGAVKQMEFNRYPDNSGAWLKQSLADGLGILPDNIVLGNGSNEVILNILLAFGGPGREAMLFEPTYSMHAVLARISMTGVVSVPLTKDFDLDGDAALAAIADRKPAIIFINNPNNPTGNLTDQNVIEKICAAGEHLVVVDEAYGEFSDETSLSLMKEYSNLAVVKTFSKAFRLAAGRVGYAIAGDAVTDGITRVRLPYSLNALSQMAATLAWKKRGVVMRALDEIISERARVFTALESIDGIKPFPSSANFILFKTERDANGVYKSLLDKQVIIRNFSGKQYLNQCLRVTIGSPAENDYFLKSLKESV